MPPASTPTAVPDTAPEAAARLAARSTGRRSDRIFKFLAAASGSLVLVIIVAIAVFLIAKAIPALRADRGNFFSTQTWNANDLHPVFGIAALAFGTLLISVIALVIAFPVAIGVALFLSHYAPRRVATVFGYLVELLAAVPSVIYGLWGFYFLNGPVKTVSQWLHTTLGWFPLFASDGAYGRSVFLGAIVLAIMVLPIIASLSREVFLQTPVENQEAALALGATRWEMIRLAVFPYARPGVIAATMLGLGRALGETIAVALVLSSAFKIDWSILKPGGNTIAANIANAFGEANSIGRGALIASGLVLFVITLAVNMVARAVVYRREVKMGSAA